MHLPCEHDILQIGIYFKPANVQIYVAMLS